MLRLWICALPIIIAIGQLRETASETSKDKDLVSVVRGTEQETKRVLDPSPYESSPDPQTSLEVLRDNTVVRKAPNRKIRRRGVVMKGARLPALESANGPGCRDVWYRVHDEAWICGNLVRLSDRPPKGIRYPVVINDELTPWPYGFVRKPALEYRMRRGSLEEVREVLKGFGFGLKGKVRIGGQSFFRTVEGNLIPREAIGVAGRISRFSGISMTPGDPWPIGWVKSREAWVYSEPSRSRHFRIGKVKRYTPFHAIEEIGKGRKRFYRFDSEAWLAASDVRVATSAPLPENISPGERWVDVDTKQQIITAYQGKQPVYTTMVSTGRIGSRTVKGKFRIWAKVSAIPMDNTDEELEGDVLDAGVSEEHHLYSLYDVPWTQFFHESYALHGVYWHDRFGNRRSHGCVNLAPLDARWFFDWTYPRLPDGWWAIHSTAEDESTLVRVR